MRKKSHEMILVPLANDVFSIHEISLSFSPSVGFFFGYSISFFGGSSDTIDQSYRTMTHSKIISVSPERKVVNRTIVLYRQ